MKTTFALRIRSLLGRTPEPKKIAFDEEAEWAEAIARAKQLLRPLPPPPPARAASKRP